MQLPKHILTALKTNKTSLGEHPSFPPEEEELFAVRLMSDTFNEISEKFGEEKTQEEMKNELSKLLSSCKKIEGKHRNELEKLCQTVIEDLFHIPEDTVTVEVNLVDKVDTATERMIPERTTDFSFDDINDMNNLTDEIYKRRMLNALVVGASMYYMKNLTEYVKDIFDIDSELPALYKKILNYNNVLIFLNKDSFDESKNTDGGRVDVSISSDFQQPIIKVEALYFPILVEETIKGFLELAISHGLPKNADKARYVIGKSDFKLAEMWDMRLGYCLWKLIEEQVEEIGYNISDIGLNFFMMTLSEMPCENFNNSLKEIFARTKRGKNILTEIINDITRQKEQDEFEDYITARNGELSQVNDEEFFTAEELLNDSEVY